VLRGHRHVRFELAAPHAARALEVEQALSAPVDRLGDAELLWSRVSHEPYATIALRPAIVRPGVETARPNVVRAGAWTDTGWPATMESAVRSGRAAAQHLLSNVRASIRAWPSSPSSPR
jgi:uncharacterized protein with NAD-binding domain and iron-sulfur cluster